MPQGISLKRFLSAEELTRLGDVLSEAERMAMELPSVIAAIRLLVLTGCRLSEVLTLRWEFVDFGTMPKITKRLVENITPANSDVFAWDDELRGFGMRVKSSGVRSYIVQYRNSHGRSKRMTIGEHGRLTAEEAAQAGAADTGGSREGGDPAERREAVRRAPTVDELCARYFVEHADNRKKSRSAVEDRRMINLLILPALRNRKVADVTRADVCKLHHSLRKTRARAYGCRRARPARSSCI